MSNVSLSSLKNYVTQVKILQKSKMEMNLSLEVIRPFLVFSLFCVARVAQWLESRVQSSDDPCVGGSNPTVGHGCWPFG
jgi:hypothetical protein